MTLSEPDDAALEVMGHTLAEAGLWQLQQGTNRLAYGIRESFLRADAVRPPGQETATVAYRLVPPDMVQAYASPDTPDEPDLLFEARLRRYAGKQCWTWDVVDLRDLDAPKYRIFLADSAGEDPDTVMHDATEITEDVLGESMRALGADAPPGNWLWWADGVPIWPYPIYHAQRTGKLFDELRFIEMFHATVMVGAYYSFWGMAVRDGSYPIRTLYGSVKGVGVRGDDVTTRRTATIAPGVVLELDSPDGGISSPQIDQWGPAIDPERLQMAISEYEKRAMIDAGLSPRTSTSEAGRSPATPRPSRASPCAVSLARCRSRSAAPTSTSSGSRRAYSIGGRASPCRSRAGASSTGVCRSRPSRSAPNSSSGGPTTTSASCRSWISSCAATRRSETEKKRSSSSATASESAASSSPNPARRPSVSEPTVEDLQKQIEGLRSAIAAERQNTAAARGERDAATTAASEWEAKHAARHKIAEGFEAQAKAWEAERAGWTKTAAEHESQRMTWQRRDALIGMGITSPDAVKVASAMYPGEDAGAFGEWLPQQTDAPWLRGYLPAAPSSAAPAETAAPAPASAAQAAPASPTITKPAPPAAVPRPNAGATPSPPVASAVTVGQIMQMQTREEILAHHRANRG